ncbi:MAG: enoyl-CoA hydratase/isomerase family protein [Actinomycetota bacterium]
MTVSDTVLRDDLPGGVRVLTLNRPERLNAWNQDMRDRFGELLVEVAVASDVRVLVITGSGRAFSAGEDVDGMRGLTEVGTRAFRALARSIHELFDLIEAMEIPVVAAVNGVAAGGGFELALSCDFRVLAADAKLVMPEAKVGLIPGSGGCSRLVRYVGLGRAKELVMLGRSLSPEEAVSWGLATEVAPPAKALDAALSLADSMSGRAPLALGMAKHVLNTCVDVDLETGRRLERLGQSVLKMTDDHREGASAFLERRGPTWTGR